MDTILEQRLVHEWQLSRFGASGVLAVPLASMKADAVTGTMAKHKILDEGVAMDGKEKTQGREKRTDWLYGIQKRTLQDRKV